MVGGTVEPLNAAMLDRFFVRPVDAFQLKGIDQGIQRGIRGAVVDDDDFEVGIVQRQE